MAADEIMKAERDREMERILTALAWTVWNLPEDLPKDADSGWTAAARISYEQNREAVRAILREARAAAKLEGVRLEDPADLVPGIFVLVETAPALKLVVTGPSTPLHFLREPGKPGCMKGCPACSTWFCATCGQHGHTSPYCQWGKPPPGPVFELKP